MEAANCEPGRVGMESAGPMAGALAAESGAEAGLVAWV